MAGKTIRELWYEQGEPSWVRRRREKDRSLFTMLSRNSRGRFLRLMEVVGGGSRTMVVPEGREAIGWWIFVQTILKFVPRIAAEEGGDVKSNGMGKKAKHSTVEGRCPCCGTKLQGVWRVSGRNHASYAEVLRRGGGRWQEYEARVSTHGQASRGLQEISNWRPGQRKFGPVQLKAQNQWRTVGSTKSAEPSPAEKHIHQVSKIGGSSPAQPTVSVKRAIQTILQPLIQRPGRSPAKNKAQVKFILDLDPITKTRDRDDVCDAQISGFSSQLFSREVAFMFGMECQNWSIEESRQGEQHNSNSEEGEEASGDEGQKGDGGERQGTEIILEGEERSRVSLGEQSGSGRLIERDFSRKYTRSTRLTQGKVNSRS